MKIIILGKNKTGKSTLAGIIKSLLEDSEVYEAGSWVRREFKELGLDTDDQYKNRITEFACNKLKHNPAYSVERYYDWLLTNQSKHEIIVGVRNPIDFVHMTSNSNYVVINIVSNKPTINDFEKGIDVILDIIKWNTLAISKVKILHLTYPFVDDKLNKQLNSFIGGI